MPGAFAVDDLIDKLTGDGTPFAPATVYRAVAAMERSGYVARVGERDGSVLFARCTLEHHHHHLVCTCCGHVAHAECPLDADMVAAATEAGFRLTAHELTLYGVCAGCGQREGRSSLAASAVRPNVHG